MTVTVEQLRRFVSVPATLEDEDLELLLAAAYGAIDGRIGEPGATTEILTITGGDLMLLSYPVQSISRIAEDGVELDPDDYVRVGSMIRRTATGPNPSTHWRGRIETTYVPRADQAERDRIAIALVDLDLRFQPGVTSVRIGEYAETYAAPTEGSTYADQREDILASYAPGGVGAFV